MTALLLHLYRQLGFAPSNLPVDTSPAQPHASSFAAAADGQFNNSSSSRQQRLHQQDMEATEPHWKLGVYQRVFLTHDSAQAWHDWNSLRGDPAQPFHYQHLLQHIQHQVCGLMWLYSGSELA